MAKIKGWTKEDDEDNYMSWKSEYDGNLLEIFTKRTHYLVVFGLTNWERPNQTGQPIFSKRFKVKKDAVDYATKYMRDN